MRRLHESADVSRSKDDNDNNNNNNNNNNNDNNNNNNNNGDNNNKDDTILCILTLRYLFRHCTITLYDLYQFLYITVL